jgi:hypothetical protein
MSSRHDVAVHEASQEDERVTAGGRARRDPAVGGEIIRGADEDLLLPIAFKIDTNGG